MSEREPVIEYATRGLEPSGDRLLRHVIACWAIIYGTLTIVTMSLHFGLALGWLRSPSSMSWDYENGWNKALNGVGVATSALLVGGGLLLLARRPLAILIIRTVIVLDLLLTVVGTVVIFKAVPTYASYWSTPAAATVNALQIMRSAWPQVLVGLLTLPPLARRMTQPLASAESAASEA